MNSKLEEILWPEGHTEAVRYWWRHSFRYWVMLVISLGVSLNLLATAGLLFWPAASYEVSALERRVQLLEKANQTTMKLLNATVNISAQNQNTLEDVREDQKRLLDYLLPPSRREEK